MVRSRLVGGGGGEERGGTGGAGCVRAHVRACARECAYSCGCAGWDTPWAAGRGQGGLPALGGRAGPHRSGSPPTCKFGVQEGEGWGPSRPPPAALPQHWSPQGNLVRQWKAAGRRRRAAWVGEKGCWLRSLCAAGAKGEKEEKPEQRRFFSREQGSREGRRPGKKKGGREMKQSREAGYSATPGLPLGRPILAPSMRPASPGQQGAGPLPPTPHTPRLPSSHPGEKSQDAYCPDPGPALGTSSLPSLQDAPQPASLEAAQ